MEKRIELEKRARKPSQITELNLDNCRSTSIVGLTDEYTALEALSLINVGLTTLKGFPKLPNLKKLELSDNRISNGLNYLTTSPKLQYLNLSGNKIKDLETLEPLQEFKHLSVLDLFNNEATQVDNYREKIFEMLPSLKFLDGFDCNDVEAPSEGEDDEDVNGNDSEDDDKKTSFYLSGLEIDLAELEELEKRVEAKKKTNGTDATSAFNAAIRNSDYVEDDLDVYLAQLKLKEAESSKAQNNENEIKICDSNEPNAVIARNVGNHNDQARPTTEIVATDPRPPVNFAILLYWFLAILNLAQAACYSNDAEGEEEDDGEENDEDDASLDSEDYDSNMSLSEASFYEENDDGEEDDDDEADSDDEGGASGAKKSSGAKDGQKVKENSENASADAAESQARGKKRKHDG